MMDYPLPGNESGEGGFEWTSPPSLNRTFMIVLEMHAWLSNNTDHRVVVHQDNWKSSNPFFTLSCLLALHHRDLFTSGATEAYAYLAQVGGIQNAWTQICDSQRRYLCYFDKTLKGFLPQYSPLILRKIIVTEQAHN